MKAFVLMVLAAFPVIGEAQQQEIQRALIQRDQQSAEFARKGLGSRHVRQLQEASHPLPAHLLPYQREKMSEEREQAGAEAKLLPAAPDYRPLPLPGGPRHGVEPVPAPSVS